jgi:hypothetical protein
MANFKLNGVLVATESGGTVTLDGATSLTGVTIPAAGITGTIAGGVTFPAGNVIQCVSGKTFFRTTVNNEDEKLHDYSITLKQANSDIYIEVGTTMQEFDSYTDYDVALAVGWKTGSSSTTSTDYTAIHPAQFSRENVAGLNAYYAHDTFSTAGQGAIYTHYQRGWSGMATLGANVVGTVINVAHWASCDNATGVVFGCSVSGNISTQGYHSFINIMEVAT